MNESAGARILRMFVRIKSGIGGRWQHSTHAQRIHERHTSPKGGAEMGQKKKKKRSKP